MPGQHDIGGSQINRAMKKVPIPAADAGLVRAICRIAGAGQDRALEASLSFAEPQSSAEVLVEGSEGMWIREASTRIEDGIIHVTAKVTLADEASWVDRAGVRMTVLTETFAADIHGCTPKAG